MQTEAAAIFAHILALVAAGSTLPVAFDAVMGEGAYQHLASDLYDTLRSTHRAN